MLLPFRVAKASLLLVVVSLAASSGCQREADRKGDASAKAVQVTVAVTGMT